LDPWRNHEKMLRAVYGNIDGTDVRNYFPEFHFFTIQDFPVLMLHIAGKHPSYSQLARKLIKQFKPKMLVCGHSHICRVVMEGGLLYVNPGAAGRNGFHKVRTALKLAFENGKPVEVRVLELGSRAEKPTAEEN
jgi:predicted phosphodiesterase